MSKQPRLPRRNYTTRLSKALTLLRIFLLGMAFLNLGLFILAISHGIGNPLALGVAMWSSAATALSIWAGLTVGNNG